jgi:hypothetical protein
MANLGYSCSGTRRNIGFESCVVNAGNEKGHVLIPKGTTIDLDATPFTLEYVTDQIQQGNFIWISNCFSQVSETPESTTETSPTGKMSVVQKGLAVTTAILKKGYEVHSSLYGYSLNDAWDVLQIFETNVIKAVRVGSTGNVIKGFSVGMYDVGGWQDTNGTVSAQTTIKYQFDDAFEVNEQGVFLTNLDFNANTGVNNIVDLEMTIRKADISDNKVYFSAVWARNKQVKITSLASSNVRLYVDGANVAIDTLTYNTANSEYELTPDTALASADVVRVTTFDATASPAVAVAKVASGKLYKGDTGTVTAVA